MKPWVLVLMLFVTSQCHSQDAPEAALIRLSNADVFAIGPVGYAGKVSETEKDFRIIVASPSAKNDLYELYRRGNAQARSYALLGIKQLDVDEFRRLTSSLAPTSQTVAVEEGCIVSQVRLPNLVKRIAAGEFDRKSK